MWVEVEWRDLRSSLKKDDKVRVDIKNSGQSYRGRVVDILSGKVLGDTYLKLIQKNSDYPICLYVLPGRKFYRWKEDKPDDVHNQLDDVKPKIQWVDQSELRLRKPHVQPCWGKCCNDPDTKAEVEEAEAALVKRIEKDKQVPEILIGDVVVDLKPGHHLRVWWEGDVLYTEVAQGKE